MLYICTAPDNMQRKESFALKITAFCRKCNTRRTRNRTQYSTLKQQYRKIRATSIILMINKYEKPFTNCKVCYSINSKQRFTNLVMIIHALRLKPILWQIHHFNEDDTANSHYVEFVYQTLAMQLPPTRRTFICTFEA